MSQANWKNVNNWHWTEKNCIEWAKTYLSTVLKNLSLTKGSQSVKISSVESVTGDADLNQRKGKIITLFDLELKLKWSGSDSKQKDQEYTGTLTIPEVAHDTETEDYVFDTRADADSPTGNQLKELVRKELSKQLIEEFLKFPDQLIKQNLSDVYIKDSVSTLSQNPKIQSAANKDAEKPQVKAFNAGESGATLANSMAKLNTGLVSLKMEREFMTSTQDLFDAIVNPDRVSIWTRTKAQNSSELNKEFDMFSGNIVCSNTLLEKPKRIVQKWRNSTWPKNNYSTVNIDLVQTSNSTKLILNQTGIPSTDLEATERNWDHYYWNPIKATFGWGFSV
ncbi:hypothetical protein BB561_004589 [Smittium simulii]|uniref:Activator of Hsp90 ATPase AHSA1-like N-terminal domain-containing protein n=1 Tax=Smittium simulii TaxID=133385 RepID=A0A2T9YF92_9FUNG|nr:hypothetical protein BB561_004589 [Smittium simulii]